MLLRRVFALLVVVLFLAGCESMPVHKVHYRLLEGESNQLPAGTAILLPLKIEVKEMTASGITEVVPAWTETGITNFQASLQQNDPQPLGKLTLVELPELSDEESALLDQHIALNETVVFTAISTTGSLSGNAWQHKSKHFDYSIGPGLSFLADKTGADKALVLIGEDVRSSAGRKTAAVVLAAFGVGIPLGHTMTIANVIDLRTGDILWLDYHISVSELGYLESEHTDQILQELFKDYPGIESYQQWLATKK